MVIDRELHQTMIARQSRLLLDDMVAGMWELMELLDLDELESDKIIELMLSQDQFPDLVPKRQCDKDIMWIKMKA